MSAPPTTFNRLLPSLRPSLGPALSKQTFSFLKKPQELLKKPQELLKKPQELLKKTDKTASETVEKEEDIKRKRSYPVPQTRYDAIGLLSDLLNENLVVVFIKGTVEKPRCGHSQRMLAALSKAKVERFVCVDVLQSQLVRDTVKELSSCETIPQLFIRGAFIGGADKAEALLSSGELEEMIKK